MLLTFMWVSIIACVCARVCVRTVSIVLLVEWIYSSLKSNLCNFIFSNKKLGVIRLSNIFHCRSVDLLTAVIRWYVALLYAQISEIKYMLTRLSQPEFVFELFTLCRYDSRVWKV